MSIAVPAAARPSLLTPLRQRDFRLLWTGLTLSLVAGQLSYIGLAWLTLQLTGSPLAMGGVLAAEAIPQGVLGLLAGAVCDRLGPRRTGVASSVVRVSAMGILAALALSHSAHMTEIYAIGIMFGAASAFYSPSRASLIPQSVSAEQLQAANSLEQSTQALGGLVGPALAGLIVARLGAGYALGADALLFVGVTLTTAAVRIGAPRNRADGAPTGILGDVVAGLRYAFTDPVLRSLILLATAMTFAIQGPIDVGLAAEARYRLGGAVAFGVTLAAFGGGSLAGSLLAGLLPPGRILLRLLGTALTFAIGMPLLGLAPNLLIAGLLAAGMGVSAGAISVAATTWLMQRTAPEMMGRLLSVLQVAQVGLSPLSLAIAGAVTQVSIPLVFVGSGAIILATVLLGATSRTVREAA